MQLFCFAAQCSFFLQCSMLCFVLHHSALSVFGTCSLLLFLSAFCFASLFFCSAELFLHHVMHFFCLQHSALSFCSMTLYGLFCIVPYFLFAARAFCFFLSAFCFCLFLFCSAELFFCIALHISFILQCCALSFCSTVCCVLFHVVPLFLFAACAFCYFSQQFLFLPPFLQCRDLFCIALPGPFILQRGALSFCSTACCVLFCIVLLSLSVWST